MGNSSFCEGFDENTCVDCPSHSTQFPCFYEKMRYMKDNPLTISDAAQRSRVRDRRPPGTIPAPPQEQSGAEFWHSVPTDERGMPFLDSRNQVMTQKELANMGSHRFRKAKEYVAAGSPGAHEAIANSTDKEQS